MSKILSQNVCYVAYPRSAQAYGDAMDSNLGEPGKDINICLIFNKMFRQMLYAQVGVPCEPGKDINSNMFVMLHIPEASDIR